MEEIYAIMRVNDEHPEDELIEIRGIVRSKKIAIKTINMLNQIERLFSNNENYSRQSWNYYFEKHILFNEID